ncbi:uncharacterized protein LOC108623609 [Ceratina calcarata]|uniref:Uncharacterized protein LOC108623609 n=1 Tax=Ceratina calcarata TaxID=156304 RepID=A0AAJ7RZM2_9HYME|nr:uncharacterized protein LOC108623609 [Ceratina calcarata]
MFVARGYLLISALVVAVIAAPSGQTKSQVPRWHLPCGSTVETETSAIVNFNDEVRDSIERLSLLHQLTMTDYLNRDYEFLYERVRIGVHDHQYIPNWVPGKKDVNLVKGMINAEPQTVSVYCIANYLPKLHMDLQKFAVAFEELMEDETSPTIFEALRATQTYLMEMLCEVENIIMDLPPIRLPKRVSRSIMSRTERNPLDDTRRLIRDWGVLMKYRDYLHAWKHVFNY